MFFSGMFEIAHPFEVKVCHAVKTDIQDLLQWRRAYALPGFRSAGMTRTRVDSTNSEPLGVELRAVQVKTRRLS
jgi:hypothetical protein